jgi:hypothetical protein
MHYWRSAFRNNTVLSPLDVSSNVIFRMCLIICKPTVPAHCRRSFSIFWAHWVQIPTLKSNIIIGSCSTFIHSLHADFDAQTLEPVPSVYFHFLISLFHPTWTTHSVQTGFASHTTSHPMSTMDVFLGLNLPKIESEHSLPSSGEVKFGDSIPPLHHMAYVVMFKHRNNHSHDPRSLSGIDELNYLKSHVALGDCNQNSLNNRWGFGRYQSNMMQKGKPQELCCLYIYIYIYWCRDLPKL